MSSNGFFEESLHTLTEGFNEAEWPHSKNAADRRRPVEAARWKAECRALRRPSETEEYFALAVDFSQIGSGDDELPSTVAQFRVQEYLAIARDLIDEGRAADARPILDRAVNLALWAREMRAVGE